MSKPGKDSPQVVEFMALFASPMRSPCLMSACGCGARLLVVERLRLSPIGWKTGRQISGGRVDASGSPGH